MHGAFLKFSGSKLTLCCGRVKKEGRDEDTGAEVGGKLGRWEELGREEGGEEGEEAGPAEFGVRKVG